MLQQDPVAWGQAGQVVNCLGTYSHRSLGRVLLDLPSPGQHPPCCRQPSSPGHMPAAGRHDPDFPESPFLQQPVSALLTTLQESAKSLSLPPGGIPTRYPPPPRTLCLVTPKPAVFPWQHCLYLLCRAMTDAFGIHMATTCPSITATGSATAGDFPAGPEVPAPTAGKQLLPAAPLQCPHKASPYLAILLTCLFSFHSLSSSKQAFHLVVHDPGRVSVTSLQEEAEEWSWAAQTSAAHSAVALEGLEML